MQRVQTKLSLTKDGAQPLGQVVLQLLLDVIKEQLVWQVEQMEAVVQVEQGYTHVVQVQLAVSANVPLKQLAFGTHDPLLKKSVELA